MYESELYSLEGMDVYRIIYSANEREARVVCHGIHDPFDARTIEDLFNSNKSVLVWSSCFSDGLDMEVLSELVDKGYSIKSVQHETISLNEEIEEYYNRYVLVKERGNKNNVRRKDL